MLSLVLFGLDVGVGRNLDRGLGPAVLVKALLEHLIGEPELQVFGHVDDVEVHVVAVEGREGHVKVDLHSLAKAVQGK